MRCQGCSVCSCKQRGGYDLRSSRYPCRGTSGSNNSASMEVGEASCTGLLPYTPAVLVERRMRASRKLKSHKRTLAMFSATFGLSLRLRHSCFVLARSASATC